MLSGRVVHRRMEYTTEDRVIFEFAVGNASLSLRVHLKI
jgi:hypothetical protein